MKNELDIQRFKIKMGRKINKWQCMFRESLITRPSDCRRRTWDPDMKGIGTSSCGQPMKGAPSTWWLGVGE